MSEQKNQTSTLLLGVAAGILGSFLIHKWMSPSSSSTSAKEEKKEDEKSQNEPKKVKFNKEVIEQEEIKDIINLAIKETIGKLSEKHSDKDKGFKVIQPAMRRRYSENDEPIIKICFTGGPCAGKTTAMSSLFNSLASLGYRVFIVPEAATTLMKAGFLIDNTNFTRLNEIQFQSCLMRYQIFIEDLIVEYAASTSDKPVVILCDRGLIDGKAYVSEQVWQSILDEMSWNEVHLRDSRYDAVVHMVTAADGAVEHYDLGTNEARYEAVEPAKRVDQTIRKNWSGHSQFYLIDNKVKSFEEKIDRVERCVLNLLGIPQATIFNCKYLVQTYEINEPGISIENFTVREFFLTSPPNMEVKIIQKGDMRSFNYTLETKVFKEDQCTTRKKQISSRDFIQMIHEKQDDTKIELEKTRMSFIYKNQFFVIDTFENIEGRPSLLRIETENDVEKVERPTFIKFIREVTDEEEYSTYNMANKDYKMPESDLKILSELRQSETLEIVPNED
ncbi:unnamed protein product [Moneuplotes crassus]|uniref:NadR/Ttd14 AAA domain-containing protein n=1 Tax=Euplotes crassus TaxID=5936 RepID=A0AAD1UFV8_EUPCR|nr:unnamed protein product [Moneuplotes crassus]